jgi:hypothetical protein
MAIRTARSQPREVLEGGCDVVSSMRIDKRLSIFDDRSWVLSIAATYVGDRAVVVQRKIHNRPEINIKTEVTQFIRGSIVENLGYMRDLVPSDLAAGSGSKPRSARRRVTAPPSWSTQRNGLELPADSRKDRVRSLAVRGESRLSSKKITPPISPRFNHNETACAPGDAESEPQNPITIIFPII